MSTIITTTSGISYANSAGAAGPYFPIKYALPVYDPFLDSYLLSATLYPASACEPISAVWPRGEVIYNTTSLTATYNYTVTNTKMLVSAAGQTGTTTITGNPFNATGYINLLNGKPLSPTVSGTSLTYSNGSWLVGGYASIPVSGTRNTVSGYSSIRDIYFPVVSYTPLTCAAGGQARGLHKVRVGNQYGSFKFNKMALFMTRYDAGGTENTSQAPVLYAIVALPNPVIKTNTGDNISYVEVDVETVISASNYFGQVSYLTNSEFNTAAPGLINYTGKVAIGSSAIPASWEPRARMHLYSEDSVDHLRFSNETFDYLSFDLGSDATRAYYNIDTSASKQVEMRVRGNISASNNIIAGNDLLVSGDFFNPHASILSDGVISTDNIIYTEFLEVYNDATFDANVNVLGNESVAQRIIVGNGEVIISATGAGGIVSASNYLLGVQQVVTNGTFVGVTLNLAGVANVVGASNLDGAINTYNGLNVFRNGGGGIPTVFITSAGVISAGGPRGIMYSRDIIASSNLSASGPTTLFSTLNVSGVTSVVDLSVWGSFGTIGNLNVGDTLNVTNDAEIQNNLNVIGETNFVGNALCNGALNVSGTLNTRGNVRLDDGALIMGAAAGNIMIGSQATGIYAQPSRVNTTGGTATSLTAACGDAMCGKVTFASGPYTSNIFCVVNTTKASSTAVIIITPFGSGTAPSHILSVDNAGITDGVSFSVAAPSGVANLYGFYFWIVNQL